MTSRPHSDAKRHTTLAVAALGALLLWLSVPSPATAAQNRIYACVNADFSTLALTSKRARCPRGDQKISWRIRGPRGKKGANGANGAQGAPGRDGQTGSSGANGANGLNGRDGRDGNNGENGQAGAQGNAGATGAAGATGSSGSTGSAGAAGVTGNAGATGPEGPIGPTGVTGIAGATGDDGATGEQGATGASGANGATGPSGATGATGEAGTDGGDAVLTGNGPMTPTTLIGGIPGQIGLLPLSGTLDQGQSMTLPANFADTKGVTQTIPRDGVVTSISGWFRNDVALSLIGTTIELRGSMYVSSDGYSPPTELSGTRCSASPGLTGLVMIGTISTFTCTGLNVPVTSGSVGFFGLEASVIGLPVVSTIPLTGSISVGVS